MRGLPADGDAISAMRKQKGWTQQMAAEACGCSARTIRNAERGDRIDTATLASLAEALDVCITSITLIQPTGIEAFGLQQTQRHVQTVRDWLRCFLQKDLAGITPLHHPETVLLIPGAESMPSGGDFVGRDQVVDHLRFVFQWLQPLKQWQDEFDAVEGLVFHRGLMSTINLKTNYKFEAHYFNEFEFKDGLIIRRVTISDLTEYRRSWGKQ